MWFPLNFILQVDLGCLLGARFLGVCPLQGLFSTCGEVVQNCLTFTFLIVFWFCIIVAEVLCDFLDSRCVENWSTNESTL